MAVEAKIVKITVKTDGKKTLEVDFYEGATLVGKDILETGAIGIPFAVRDYIRDKCAALDDSITRQGTITDIKENDTLSAGSFAAKAQK